MARRRGWKVPRRRLDPLARGALAVALLAISPGCSRGVADGGWQKAQTDIAERQVRDAVNDDGARFPHTDVVGDDKTGQVCGLVRSHGGAPVRFVFYIDQTAGPYVDASSSPAFQARFESAWQADCIGEGYR